MCKIQIWDTSITSDDKEHTWETILNECSQKVWKGFGLKEKANIQSEGYRVETVTKETGSRSRSETLSNLVAPNAGIMVIFEKQISCPIQVLLFQLSSKESYFSCKTDAILFLWLQRPTSCSLLSTQPFLCKKSWRREKLAETSNKSRTTGPSNLRLCANFKFETRLSPWVI